MSTKEFIENAIKNQKGLKIAHNGGIRFIMPIAIGLLTSNNPAVLCLSTRRSLSSDVTGIRSYLLSDIEVIGEAQNLEKPRSKYALPQFREVWARFGVKGGAE